MAKDNEKKTPLNLLDRIADAVEDIASGGGGGGGGGGGSELPAVTSADNGKVLGVVDGEWDVADVGGTGGVLVANIDTTTMTIDKTWQEIHDAGFAIIHEPDQQDNRITHCWQVEAIYTSSVPGGTHYAIDVIAWLWTGSAYSPDQLSLSCDDPDEYPSL